MSATINDLNDQLKTLRIAIDQLKSDVTKLTPPSPIDLSEQLKVITDATSDLNAVDVTVKTVIG